MSSTDQALNPKKDDELWYEDGTVVIIAGDVAFRLYKGVLARASPIFQDMFAIGQPGDAETMDCCPVVRLPDSPVDLRYFFSVLYKPNFK